MNLENPWKPLSVLATSWRPWSRLDVLAASGATQQPTIHRPLSPSHCSSAPTYAGKLGKAQSCAGLDLHRATLQIFWIALGMSSHKTLPNIVPSWDLSGNTLQSWQFNQKCIFSFSFFFHLPVKPFWLLISIGQLSVHWVPPFLPPDNHTGVPFDRIFHCDAIEIEKEGCGGHTVARFKLS